MSTKAVAAGWAAVALTIYVIAGAAHAADDESAPRVDSDGTLHTRPLTLPPSDLWSPELKRFYSQFATGKLFNQNFPLPERNAPQAEWDRFVAWNDAELAAPLAWLRARYPVEVQDTKIAGVRVGVVSPRDGVAPRNRRRVLINLHGGGFILNAGLGGGQAESIPVASIGRIKVITLDYRQAPRHEYPAATEDVAAVYRALLEEYPPDAVGIYGCSAGGFLAAQAIAWFQSRKLPRPGAVGVLCATAGPALSGGDSRMWATGIVPGGEVTPERMAARAPMGWYMANAAADDPRAYPGIGCRAGAISADTASGRHARAERQSRIRHPRALAQAGCRFLAVCDGGRAACHSCPGAGHAGGL